MNLEPSQSTFLELELPGPASLQCGLLRYGGPQSGPAQSEFLESNVRRPWFQTIFVLPEILKTKFGKVGMLEPSRHLRMILNRLWNQEAGPQGISEIAFPHTHIMLGDAPHSQLWSGGPLGRDHGKRSGQHDPQAPPSKTQVPPIWHDLACGRVQKSPPVTGSSNRKSPGPSRICRFSIKNMSTLAKNMSTPAKNMSVPAKNMSTRQKICRYR